MKSGIVESDFVDGQIVTLDENVSRNVSEIIGIWSA